MEGEPRGFDRSKPLNPDKFPGSDNKKQQETLSRFSTELHAAANSALAEDELPQEEVSYDLSQEFNSNETPADILRNKKMDNDSGEEEREAA